MHRFDSAPEGGRISGHQLRLAEGLWRAAVIALALLPLGMAIAHRSSPAFLGVSAFCALGATAAEGQLRPFLRETVRTLTSPLGGAALAFFGWCLVSIGWSEFKLISWRAFGEFWLSIMAALVLAVTLARRMPSHAFWMLAAAFVVACLSILLELQTGMALRRALEQRAYGFVFNRSVLTLLVLTLPLAAWLVTCVRHGWAYALGLLLLLAGTILRSESDAALLGVIVVCIGASIAFFAPRVAGLGLAISLAVMALMSPFIGEIGARLITPSLHEQIASSHSQERVALWTSFGSVVRQEPFFGTGFGTSPRMAEAAVARKVPTEHRPMLSIGHPHNIALQVWTELGAVGIAIALGVLFLLLRTISRQPHIIRISSLALIAGASTVSFVGHGAWQGWWAASLGAAITWMIAIRRTQPETGP